MVDELDRRADQRILPCEQRVDVGSVAGLFGLGSLEPAFVCGLVRTGPLLVDLAGAALLGLGQEVWLSGPKRPPAVVSGLPHPHRAGGGEVDLPAVDRADGTWSAVAA